jgi:hypothetical protein
MAAASGEQSTPSVLSAEKLQLALSGMSMSTRAVHSDDCFSAHRAIAPGIQVAVNYRYARDPNQLVPMENHDVGSNVYM